MNLFHRLLALAFAMLAMMSCSNDFVYDTDNTTQTPVDPVEEGTTELRFGVPVTRATIDGNLDLRWQRGDRIMVMAYDNTTMLFSKEASFWANLTNNTTSGSQGYFKAKFDTEAEADVLASIEDMTDGKCYAVSPVRGVTIDGTTATMTIPAVQSGEYSNAPDFMTARSNSISQLKLCSGGTSGSEYKPEESNYINDINLQFTHHTHAFRVSIPSNLMGKRVAKAYLKFPFPVVGDVTVDYTTGAVTAVNNTSDLVVVEFPQSKGAGDEFWVFINSVENKGKVDIRFQTEDGAYTERRLANFTQKNWVAGSVSKINVSIPQATTLTTIQCSVPNYSQLGEPVTDLHFHLADGFYFADYATSSSTTINQSSSYIANNLFVLFSDMIDDSFRAAKHSLTFESESALAPNPDPIVFGSTITVGQLNSYELTAPYLFFEDFSTVPSFSSNDAHKTSNAGSKDAYSFLNGWTGGRIGASAGLSVRIACRRETSVRYDARLDSAPIKNVKDGSSVKVKVLYDYGMDQDHGGISPKDVGQTCYEGRITDPSALKSGDDSGDYDSSFNIKEDDNASWTNLPYKNRAYSFSDCTSSTRLSWRTRTDNMAGANNNTCWLYIDNVRVSIVK